MLHELLLPLSPKRAHPLGLTSMAICEIHIKRLRDLLQEPGPGEELVNSA